MARRGKRKPQWGSSKWWRLTMKQWSYEIAPRGRRRPRPAREQGYWASRPYWSRMRQEYERKPINA